MLNDFWSLVFSVTPWITLFIALLLLLRKTIGNKISARFFRLAWMILALRIVLPFDITLPQPPVEIALPVTRTVVSAALPAQYTVALPMQPMPPLTANAPEIIAAQSFDITRLVAALPYLWLAGALIFLVLRFASYVVFMCRLAKTRKEFRAEKMSVRIFTAPDIPTPLLAGLLRPAIYLPEDVAPSALPYVLAHEDCHRRCGDIALQFLLLFATAMQWFNPLVHVMAHTAQRDIELACDEKVLRDQPIGYRKAYGAAVLDTLQKTRRRSVLSTGFGGAPKTLKARFVQMFDMKTKKRGTALLCMLLVLVLATGSLVACTVQKADSAAEIDSHTATANKILQTMFTNPDEAVVSADPIETDALARHVKEKYADTCDDKLIEIFLAEGNGWQFDIAADKRGCTTTASEVLLTKVSDGHYTFILPVTATLADGTTTTAEVKGNLQFDENGKANYLRFSSLPDFASLPILKNSAANISEETTLQFKEMEMFYNLIMNTADKSHFYVGYDVRNLLLDKTPEQIAEKYGQILQTLQTENPQASYTVIAVPPITQQAAEKHNAFASKSIKALNEALRKMAIEKNASFLEIAPSLLDESGNLSLDFATQDGMELSAKGYAYWENWMRTGQDLIQQAQSTAAKGAWTWPVPQYTAVTRGMAEGHRGIDIAAPKGTEICAAAAGKVIEVLDENVDTSALTAESKWSYGKYVLIDHGNQISTLYAHCDSTDVQVGQMVQAGEVIAAVGSTGTTTGNALHFEMQQMSDGALLDPTEYFN